MDSFPPKSPDDTFTDALFDFTEFLTAEDGTTDPIASVVALYVAAENGNAVVDSNDNPIANTALTVYGSLADPTGMTVTFGHIGGDVDSSYQVSCKITTTAGNTVRRSGLIPVQNL
jgi:hypothetical protein